MNLWHCKRVRKVQERWQTSLTRIATSTGPQHKSLLRPMQEGLLFLTCLFLFLSLSSEQVISQMPLGQQASGQLTGFCTASSNNANDITMFSVQNHCPYTIWAAAVPGGGRKLNPNEVWILGISTSVDQRSGRVWARTNCTFNTTSRGNCQTGDCDGLLQCQSGGTPPHTLAEYALSGVNKLDFFDMSLVNGFNVPMEFGPTSEGCTRGIRCTADINGQCPAELRAPGGCNNPCMVFKTDQYCCTSEVNKCGPTNYSRFFKDLCSDAYTYPYDDQNSTFTCPTGTSYKVVFCP